MKRRKKEVKEKGNEVLVNDTSLSSPLSSPSSPHINSKSRMNTRKRSSPDYSFSVPYGSESSPFIKYITKTRKLPVGENSYLRMLRGRSDNVEEEGIFICKDVCLCICVYLYGKRKKEDVRKM
jgi:hypothetical protein